MESCAECDYADQCAKAPCFEYDLTSEKVRSCSFCINRYGCAAVCPKMG